MVTPDDIELYLSQHGAAQRIGAMREDFPRWIRRLRELGVADVPLRLGSESARRVDLFALEVSENPDPQIRRRAHDIRDTMPELRPYKGR